MITGRGRSICTATQIANATLTAQSGMRASPHIKLSTLCARAKKQKKAKKHHHG